MLVFKLKVLKLSSSTSQTYKIEGMTCASCAQVIEDNSRILKDLESIQVNYVTEKAELKFGPQFDETAFYELMQKIGYRAISANSIEAKEEKGIDLTLVKSIVSLMIGALLMGLSMGPLSEYLDHRLNNIIQMVCSSLIIYFFGKPYLKSVLSFLQTRNSNMNTLIGLGISAAYVYSIVLMFMSMSTGEHAHVYFEAIPFVIGFTLLGHFLDEKAKTKARSSLSSLYKMQIKFASKIDGTKEVNTPVIELKAEDIIRLRPGEKVPLDGIVKEGFSHCDESMISGESRAVSKEQGSNVFAGSLNLEGSLQVIVKKEMNQTFISDVVSYVEKAQLKKAPIQKYADKIVHYFVPAIIYFSLFTFFIWFLLNSEERSYQAFSHMIAVLLIACPCALGLAVPMAVMITTAEAAKSGLLIGGGEVIERASDINVIVFDKTGTLTAGKPRVIHFHSNGDSDEFLRISASVASNSNHPLSRSISEFVKDKNIKLSDPDKFKNIPGLGIESQIDEKKVLIGNASFLRQQNIEVQESDLVGSHVYIGIDQKLAGFFVIADPVKKEARDTILKLKNAGKEIWMLTGDNVKIAEQIAKDLGIENYKANVLPVDKADFILELKAKGKKVAMIGDGINDAPALASANLSMAMSGGSDVAIAASDISILEGRIECVAFFFSRSKETMKIIKENLFLSFVYNLLCIPLAAGFLHPWLQISLTPMWASLAMGFSSLSVILSSLRLKKSLES